MILNYHLFTESQRYKEIKKIDINLIRDLFQEYIDKYGLVEVNNSMPWRDMEILDFKIIIGHPLSVYSSELEDNFNGEKNSELGALFILVNDKLPTNMNQDFLSFCERLRKFGYWSNIKHKLIVHKNWIYIYFYKENDIVYELKSNNIDIETIKDLFQEYIDNYKLKNVPPLTPISEMNEFDYKLMENDNTCILIICGDIPNIENYYHRLLKFGYYCKFEKNISSKFKFIKSPERSFTKLVISKSNSIFESKIDDTLYIFDFDDTLVLNPRFEDLAIEYLKEDVTIRSLLLSSIRKIGVKLSDLRWENGKVFINDPDQKIDVKSEWIRKGKRVYLTPPDKFYFTDMSMPINTTKLSEFYNKIPNKAIVTGRHSDIDHKIIDSLNNWNLDIPNYGLHCYPGRKQTEQKIGEWKAKTIVDIIKNSTFNNVYFYDDNSKWVNKVTSLIKKELPHINWNPIKYNHKNG